MHMHFFLSSCAKEKDFFEVQKVIFQPYSTLHPEFTPMGEGPYGPSVCHENKKILLKLLPPLTLVCIYINKRKNAFSIFLKLIYLRGGALKGVHKKMKDDL